MIGYLRGRLLHAGPDEVLLDVGGVGYRAAVPTSALGRLPPPGGECALYCHLHVREDALQLYGFLAAQERDLFELLLSVSGVGPKLALQVLSALNPAAFRRAVAQGDDSLLRGIPGIGRKTAQRIVLELKDRLGALPPPPDAPHVAGVAATGDPAGPEATALAEAAAALESLGYSRGEASRAVEAAREALMRRAAAEPHGAEPRAEDLVRQALRDSAR